MTLTEGLLSLLLFGALLRLRLTRSQLNATERVEHEISALHGMLARRLPETMLGRFSGCVPSGPNADYAWKATPIPVAVVRLNEKGQWEPEKADG